MAGNRVMLVEDEDGVRLLLRKIIEKQGGFEIVCESAGFSDAIVQFRRLLPDVVFMDIGIQGESGVECARIMTEIAPKTKIIFATAHAEYMPEAFELSGKALRCGAGGKNAESYRRTGPVRTGKGA